MKGKLILITFLTAVLALPASGKEFLNTFLHINLGMIWNVGSFGPISSREKQTALSTEESDTFSYGKPSFLHTALDFSVDLVPFPPLVLGYESHAVKIGLRGGMRMHSFREMLDVTDDGNEKTYSGTLMTYYEGYTGLVIRYAPAVDITGFGGNYSADKGLVFYCLYGRIFKGNLNAYTAKNDYETKNETGFELTDNSTKIRAHKIEFGIGGEIAVWSVNMGMSLSYALVFMELKSDVYGDVGTDSRLSEINIGFYISLPVEYML